MPLKRILQSTISGGNVSENALLRAKTMLVSEMNEEIRVIIQDLRDTMWAYPFCVGLSAPQIGYKYAISVVNPYRENADDDLIIINPEVISVSGKKDRKYESCMSVWGKMGEVERRDKLRFKYRNEKFDLIEKECKGFESRIIQHELDHLQGILYTDIVCAGLTLTDAEFFDDYDILEN